MTSSIFRYFFALDSPNAIEINGSDQPLPEVLEQTILNLDDFVAGEDTLILSTSVMYGNLFENGDLSSIELGPADDEDPSQGSRLTLTYTGTETDPVYSAHILLGDPNVTPADIDVRRVQGGGASP